MKTSGHSYRCLIPFNMADPGGVLFFGNAFTLAHQAFEHFVMNQLKYSWISWFQNRDWIVPIRHAEAEFLHPIQAGQECQIVMTVKSFSNSSFTMISRFHQNGLCCSIETVHIFCHRETKEKTSIPPDVRAKLSSLQLNE